MEAVFYSYLGINIVLLMIVFYQSRSPVFTYFAGNAVNPLLVFCLLAILFNLDFIMIWSSLSLVFLERVSSIPAATVLDSYGAYTVIFIGNMVGFTVALSYWRQRLTVSPRASISMPDRAANLSASVLFWAIIAVSAPVLLRDHSLYLSYQVVARENPLRPILTFLIPVGAAFFVAYRRLSVMGLVVLAFSALVLGLSGGPRGPVILMALILAVWYAPWKRISAFWYLPTLPGVAVFLAFSRYMFREGEKYASYSEFVMSQGGYVALFFSGEEVSFAKMFSVVYDLAPTLPRAPFESLIALLVLPVPRSFFTLKPFGASALFTQYVAPLRWEWTKSELLVTGYGDMYWQFGLLGAVVAVGVLGFGWLWMCLKVIHKSRESVIVWIPLLIWWMFLFMRGDLFNIGLLLWPAMIFFVAHRLLRRIFHMYERTSMSFER